MRKTMDAKMQKHRQCIFTFFKPLYFLIFLFLLPCQGWSLTLSEKVGQLLVVHFHGEEANADAEMLIQQVGVGGFIYYNWANGLSSPEQVKKLSQGLQKLALNSPSGLPLIIAVDQEGGKVTRLQNGFSPMLDQKTLASFGNPLVANAQAFITGRELRKAGINVNFAPVVDIGSSSRCFGITPEIVITFARATIEGYHQSGIKATLKHYPGHGSAIEDSHFALPIVHKSLKELQKHELRPFAELASRVDIIMTGHLLIKKIDSKNCATLSAKLLNMLRKDLGFKGVIITDSLVMHGLLKGCDSIEDAAIRALQAGCDMLLLGGKLLNEEANSELMPKDIVRIHQAIIEAVLSGRLNEEIIDRAIERILSLKTLICEIS